MSVTLEHTPLPWCGACPTDADYEDWRDLNIVMDSDANTRVAFMANDGTPENRTARANAAFIVRACNNHHALVEALRKALDKAWTGHALPDELRELEAVLAKAEGK